MSDLPRIGKFRILIHLMREPDEIELHSSAVFADDFVYQLKLHPEFYEDYMSLIEYEHLEVALKGLPEGVYEIVGDFHYHGWHDYEGEYCDDFELVDMGVRQLNAEDIHCCCPEYAPKETVQ